MDSVRQQKYARLIQKELGDIFLREGKNWYGNQFVTVTGVKVTSDLSIARVHISVFKAPKPEDVLLALKKNHHEVRHQLGLRIGKQARIIPDLQFFIDNSLDYAEHIDKLFKNLHIPPAKDPGTEE